MINFPKRRSAKPAQPQSLPKDAKPKKSSVLAGFRPSSFGGRRGAGAGASAAGGAGASAAGGAAGAAGAGAGAASKTMLWKQRYIAHEVEEEKKDDAADVTAVKGERERERELELVRELVREHQVTPSTPVDLDVTLDYHDVIDNSNSNDNDNNDEGVAFQDDVCLLFQEDDEEDHNQDAEEVGLQSVELPAQLLRAPRGSPGRPVAVAVAVAVPNLLNLLKLRDQPPTVTTDMTTPKKTRPPTEINIDMHAVPPSPMRDPNISRQPQQQQQPPSQPDDLLNHYRCRSRSPSPPAEMDAFAFGLQSQLWDAERLVRVILGKNYQPVPVPVPVPASSQQPHHLSLDNGSILQAIQRFAVMQQELVELRRQVETNDGDPPAILTNLTSPATTRNASSLATTPSSMPPSTTIPRNLSSSLSPHSQDPNHHNHYRNTTTPSSLVSVSNSSPQSLKTTRNALVLAARKCQALETQLKRSNERVEELELELELQFQVQSHERSQSSSQQQQQQQQRIQALEAENRTLLAQRQQKTPATSTSTSFSHTPAEVEAILTKLHSIPAKSVSQDERQRIRQYVLDMLQHTSAEKAATTSTSTSTIAPQVAPEEWKAAQAQIMASLQTQLVATDHRAKNHHFSRHVHELESELYLDHDRHDDEDEEGVTNPLQVAKQQIRQRTARIAELEASHVRLQSLLHLALRETPQAQSTSPSPPQPQHQHQQPLQDETNKPIPVKSGRFAKLEEEHQALVESLRILEDQDVQL